MGFSLAKDFLILAAKKYKLDTHAVAALMCEKTRGIISKEFPEYSKFWDVKKFVKGKISIAASNSAASSELFLKTNHLLECLKELELPAQVDSINIIKE